MRLSSIRIACLGCAFTMLPLLAHPREGRPNGQTQPAATGPATSPADSKAGERAFQQNCARCHDAPQSFSPRISGTILRHMRVRAPLSEEDERRILKFLNP